MTLPPGMTAEAVVRTDADLPRVVIDEREPTPDEVARLEAELVAILADVLEHERTIAA